MSFCGSCRVCSIESSQVNFNHREHVKKLTQMRDALAANFEHEVVKKFPVQAGLDVSRRQNDFCDGVSKCICKRYFVHGGMLSSIVINFHRILDQFILFYLFLLRRLYFSCDYA